MKVVIVGAGVSAPAGYPLASALLQEVGAVAASPFRKGLHAAWKAWEAYRDSASPDLRLILNSANPEIVLSLPDLMVLTVEHEDRWRIAESMKRVAPADVPTNDTHDEYFQSPEREALRRAMIARSRLIACLDEYLWYRHHTDQRSPRESRAYLGMVLGELTTGDVVIIFNWDTLVERWLAEASLWRPTNGYGFPKRFYLELVQSLVGDRYHDLEENEVGLSAVTVLKLHGSFGWVQVGDGVALEDTRFLDEFPLRAPKQHRNAMLRDTDLRYGPKTIGPLLIFPTYLKDLSNLALQGIWQQAAAVLAQASTVDIWGYSLPESDSAARALLHPLVVRSERDEVKVVVHDPSVQTLNRWRHLFGWGNCELRNEGCSVPSQETSSTTSREDPDHG